MASASHIESNDKLLERLRYTDDSGSETAPEPSHNANHLRSAEEDNVSSSDSSSHVIIELAPRIHESKSCDELSAPQESNEKIRSISLSNLMQRQPGSSMNSPIIFRKSLASTPGQRNQAKVSQASSAPVYVFSSQATLAKLPVKSPKTLTKLFTGLMFVIVTVVVVFTVWYFMKYDSS